MPATIVAPVAQPPLNSVIDIGVTFTAENAQAPAYAIFLDANGKQQTVQAQVPRDTTFLALSAATGSAKVRLYNVVGPLLGFTPNVIT
jgi:hypothetical protein